MASILKKLTNAPVPLVLAQYTRDDKGVGEEEHFHWALIAITDAPLLLGPAFQVLDRHYRDAAGNALPVEWSLSYITDMTLTRTTKCLGGVQIGSARTRELPALVEAIRGHVVESKFEGWNCRDWVAEIIAVLRPRGWIDEGVVPPGGPPKDALLPLLRRASNDTVAANPAATDGGTVKHQYAPVIIWIQ